MRSLPLGRLYELKIFFLYIYIYIYIYNAILFHYILFAIRHFEYDLYVP